MPRKGVRRRRLEKARRRPGLRAPPWTKRLRQSTRAIETRSKPLPHRKPNARRVAANGAYECILHSFINRITIPNHLILLVLSGPYSCAHHKHALGRYVSAPQSEEGKRKGPPKLAFSFRVR